MHQPTCKQSLHVVRMDGRLVPVADLPTAIGEGYAVMTAHLPDCTEHVLILRDAPRRPRRLALIDG